MLVFVTGLWFESTCNKRRHSQQNQTTTTPPRHAIFPVHHRHCRFSSTAPSPKPLWLLRRYLQLQKKKKKKKIRVTPHSDYLTIFFCFFSILNIYIDIGMRDWRRRMLSVLKVLKAQFQEWNFWAVFSFFWFIGVVVLHNTIGCWLVHYLGCAPFCFWMNAFTYCKLMYLYSLLIWFDFVGVKIWYKFDNIEEFGYLKWMR